MHIFVILLNELMNFLLLYINNYFLIKNLNDPYFPDKYEKLIEKETFIKFIFGDRIKFLL